MIRLLTGFFFSLMICSHALAEFVDPMQPPAFALNKYRLEKIKDKPVIKQSTSKTEKKSGWVLHSILYSENRQHAIVNNTLVKKGDKIDGAKIMRVSANSVKLAFKGKIINLKVNDFKARGLATDKEFKLIKKTLKENKI